MGQTWNLLIATKFSDKTFLGNIVALDDYMVIKGKPSKGRPCIYVYDGNTIQTMPIPAKVGRIAVASSRFIRFMDGILCAPSPVDEYMQGSIGNSIFPLFFMNGFSNPRGPDVTIIREFQRKLVRDIIVRNSTCYILTSSKEDNGHTGRIYSSSDLSSWVMLAEFPVPTSPYSFELMGGAFYVGLGYGFCMDDGDNESGGIYKIDLIGSPQVAAQAPPQPLRWDAAQGWQDGTAAVLYQNQPNPFNPETWIPYELREDADVAIKIYEATGRLIRTLNLGRKSAGLYTDNGKAAYWDGKNEADEQVASGIYFYNMQAGEFSATKKMIVAR
jgi:hypothetical protein